METKPEYNYEAVNEFLRKETVRLVSHVLDYRRYKSPLEKEMVKESLAAMRKRVDTDAENLSQQERAQYYRAIENLRAFLERTK